MNTLKGGDSWPKKVLEAYWILNKHRKYNPCNHPEVRYGVAFASVEEGKRKDKADRSEIKCYACVKMGHYSKKGPEKEETANDNVEAEIFESEEREAGVNFTFIIMGEEKLYPYGEYESEGSEKRVYPQMSTFYTRALILGHQIFCK